MSTVAKKAAAIVVAIETAIALVGWLVLSVVLYKPTIEQLDFAFCLAFLGGAKWILMLAITYGKYWKAVVGAFAFVAAVPLLYFFSNGNLLSQTISIILAGIVALADYFTGYTLLVVARGER